MQLVEKWNWKWDKDNVALYKTLEQNLLSFVSECYQIEQYKWQKNTIQKYNKNTIQMQKDLYLRFIDYTKAFNRERYKNLHRKDIRVFRNLHWKETGRLWVESESSECTNNTKWNKTDMHFLSDFIQHIQRQF